MLVWDGRKRTREAGAWIGAVGAAMLLLAALATPMAAAAPSKTTLSNAVVSPRTGTTATTIFISVVFRNSDGSRSDGVTATVGGQKHVMAAAPGGGWGKGVVFSWSGKLATGTHAITIDARAKDHSEATLAAGNVTIGAVATPTPTATPTPKPKPTAKPTPTPTPTPTVAPRRTATPTPRPTPRRTQSPVVTAFSAPTPVPTLIVPATPTPTPVVPPLFAPADATSTPDPDAVIAIIAGGTGPGGSAGGGPDTRGLPGGKGSGHPAAWSPVAGLFALVGLPAPSFPSFSLAPTLVTTTGAVTAAMAFGLFGRPAQGRRASVELIAVAAARSQLRPPIAPPLSPAGPRTVSTPTPQVRAPMRRRLPRSRRWRP